MATGLANLVSEKEFTVIRPTRQPRPHFYVPQNFVEIVTLHIVKNALRSLRPPLMLVIQGPKGEGKSAMTLEICSRSGIQVVILPGSSLSGIYEKEAVLILRDAYVHASALRETTKQPVVLVIEDLDTSVVSAHVDRRYTVSTQLVSGAMMYLCQDPYHMGDKVTHRIPIIASGNDFTNLYEPLTRHGRACFFEWAPDIATKIEILRSMFDGLMPPAELDRVPSLVDRFSKNGFENEPIAFYEQIVQDIHDDSILAAIREGRAEVANLNQVIDQRRPQLTVSDLIAFGERKRNSRPQSYIRPRT